MFVAIFHQFGEVLVPILVELMQRHHQPVDPNNLHAILVKDAVYNAVGLAAFDLYDEVKIKYYNEIIKLSIIVSIIIFLYLYILYTFIHLYILGKF